MQAAAPRMQRVRGAASVSLGRAGLRDLAQSGSARAMLPRTDAPWPEVVFLNTAGGITSGDRLDYALDVGAGTRVTGGTQTAERAYRAPDGPGRVVTRLIVGAGARLDWLPQEVIVFEGADLARETVVDLAPGATFLGVESLVLGRAAHGETVTRARLDDLRTIRCCGALLHQEHLALDRAALADPAALGGMRAFATLVLAGPDAADALGPLRAALAADGPVTAAAGAWDGRLVARLHAPEAAPLRRLLVRAIVTLRGVPMPRVWQCDALGRDDPEGAMNLTPREKDKLLVSMAAMVARGRLARGVALNHPEAIALITDYVVEGARDGRSVSDLMRAGAHVVTAEQCMEGVPEMIHDVQVEATFPDGTKLVTVHHPIRSRADA